MVMTIHKPRAQSALNGVIAVNKPAGMTSHDVVQTVRRISREKRVGHTGTLDPSAIGVLVLCLGQATRVARYIEGADKEYTAIMRLGVATDTQDAEGRVIETTSCSLPDQNTLLQVMQTFIGEIDQEPPAFSAIKISGVRSYKLARQGIARPIPSRRVTVHAIKLISYENFLVTFTVHCSKGVYIRTLCADMGKALGTGAHLASLIRTRSGRFRLEDAVSLDSLGDLGKSGNVRAALISIDDSLPDFPVANVNGPDARKIACGNAIPWPTGHHIDRKNARLRVHNPPGRLIAIAVPYAGMLRPEVVLNNNDGSSISPEQ